MSFLRNYFLLKFIKIYSSGAFGERKAKTFVEFFGAEYEDLAALAVSVV